MILSRTQHINHITHLVAVNKLYDTTAGCLRHIMYKCIFLDYKRIVARTL